MEEKMWKGMEQKIPTDEEAKLVVVFNANQAWIRDAIIYYLEHKFHQEYDDKCHDKAVHLGPLGAHVIITRKEVRLNGEGSPIRRFIRAIMEGLGKLIRPTLNQQGM